MPGGLNPRPGRALGVGIPTGWRPRGGAHVAAPLSAAASPSPSATPTTSRRARVEAALWLAETPLSSAKIARAAGLEGPAEASDLVAELRRSLAARRSALEVVEVAGGFRLTSRPEYSPWVEKTVLATGALPRAGGRLSTSAAETLAIVAYRQPVVRAEVEAIRGVGSADVLRQLLDADLLRIVGRSEELGRPLLYGTTERFLELYGLGSLEDLPGLDEGARDAGPTT